jgi:hypothetical protein
VSQTRRPQSKNLRVDLKYVISHAALFISAVDKPSLLPNRQLLGGGGGDKFGHSMKLTTHLHLVPRSRIYGTLPPHPFTPLCHVFKHRQLQFKTPIKMISIATYGLTIKFYVFMSVKFVYT